MSRTQADIIARYRAADDFFGFSREVLVEAMTADSIVEAAGASLEDAKAVVAEVEQLPSLERRARDYLAFAVGKIVDHRGISAGRSVQKLTEYAWLLGRDDVVKAMEDADYVQYGAPQVRAFAEGFGWPFLDAVTSPSDREALERMSLGRACEDDCDSGCGA